MAKISTFKPLKFNGSTDGALQCLYLALVGQYGEQPSEVLERISNVVPTDGIRLVAQFDSALRPAIEEYAIALDPKEPGIAPYMNAGTLTLEWVDSEGYTRIGIKPDPAFHEALALLHDWLGVMLGQRGLLLGHWGVCGDGLDCPRRPSDQRKMQERYREMARKANELHRIPEEAGPQSLAKMLEISRKTAARTLKHADTCPGPWLRSF